MASTLATKRPGSSISPSGTRSERVSGAMQLAGAGCLHLLVVRSSHQDEGGQGGPTALAALVWLDRDSYVRHVWLRERPVLPFEGGALRAEVELLPAEFSIVLAAIARDRERELLGSAHVRFLDFKAHLADRLGRVEDDEDRLFTDLLGHPPSTPRAPVMVEGMLDRMVGVFGCHVHGGDGRDWDLLPILGERLGLENLLAHRDLPCIPSLHSTTSLA